jgi:D-amino peptidase
VTGDDLACEEAESLYPGVQTACVKTAVDRYTAPCLSPEAAHVLIREAAQRVVEETDDLTQYIPEPPYSFTVEFATASAATASAAARVLFFPGWSASTTGASRGRTRTTECPARCS